MSFANEPSTQQDQLSDVPSGEANSSVERNETSITPAASVTAETVPEIMQNPRYLLTHSLAYSLTHSYSLTHLLIYSLIYLLTHSYLLTRV